jgi:Gpi18-like mannosyltransferase
MTPTPPALPSVPVLAGLLALSLLAHWLFFPLITTDMSTYNVPWLHHIVTYGRLAGFAHPFANYTPPYLYLLSAASLFYPTIPALALVKLIGVGANIALAVALARLARMLGIATPARFGAIALVLPSVVINAALLGQCDALWAAPLVMALACAVERRHLTMLLWCGVAMGFKLQAGLAAPFFLGLVLARRVPVWQWLAAPAALVALMLPALALGWPLADLIAIYPRQSAWFPDLARNAPNIWSIVQQLHGIDGTALVPFAYLAAAAAAAAFIMRMLRVSIDGSQLVLAALLATLLMAGLLPKMHDRYFFLADVLALAYAATAQSRCGWRIFVLVELGSTLALFAYLSGIEGFAAIGGALMAWGTWLALRDFLAAGHRDHIPLWNAKRQFAALRHRSL